MKKLLPILTIIIFMIVIALIFVSMSDEKRMVVIQDNNHNHEPLDIQVNHYQDSQCGMTIGTNKHSAQAVSPDGRTWFFDDPGCLALWYKNIKFKDHAIIWVYSNDTNKYIDGKKAWYNRTDATTMGYGFGAYQDKNENMLNFSEMLNKMYNGENLRNKEVRKKLLGK